MMRLNIKDNWTYPVAGDGRDRSHFPKIALWTALIRVPQTLIALLMLILTSFSASRIGSNVDGFGLTWFSFIWTFFYFGWLGVAYFKYPLTYHVFAHLSLEIITNVFWLATWAVLASEATTVSDIEQELGSSGLRRLSRSYRDALSCIKAAAGIGALEWLLFIITLVFLSLIRDGSKTADPEANTQASEMQGYPTAPAPAAPPHDT